MISRFASAWLIGASAVVALATSSGLATAGNITFTTVTDSAVIAGTPSTPGLKGGVYFYSATQGISGAAGNGSGGTGASAPGLAGLVTAANFVNSTTPNASYAASHFNYSGGDTTPTNTFLGADSNGTAASDSTPLESTVLDATGYVDVGVAGTYTFSMNADDAGAIYVDGTPGVAGSGTMVVGANYGNGGQTGSVDFTSAGVYQVEILYYNSTAYPYAGGAGFNFSTGVPAGGSLTYYASVPEPATLGLMGLAGLGILLLPRRKRVG